MSLAIQQILNKNASQFSFEELYRTAYKLVLHRLGGKLYDNSKKEIRKFLEQHVAADLVMNDMSSVVIKRVNAYWEDFCICLKLVSDVLMYLDRVYATEERVPLIYDVGITLFRDAVIRNGDPRVGDQLFDIVIGEIEKERNGQVIDRLSIKSLVGMLETVPENRIDGESIYTTEFEPKLEKSTESFYKQAAMRLLEGDDAYLYLKKVDQWINEETDRCNLYLSESSLVKIIRVVDENLIINRSKDVVLKGMGNWVENDKFDELSLLYKLITRVSETHDDMRDFISQDIISRGRKINSEAEHNAEEAKSQPKGKKMSPTQISITWVTTVLTLKDKFDAILIKCFKGNHGLQMVMENAFARFVNENKKCAEFLSLFVDDNLKKSLKGKTDEEIEQVLEKAIVLFRFISDKDLFETYFKAHLAKRLLNNKSISIDAERNMIAKVKMEVGTSFTSKLEGMFRDMEISRELMSSFKSSEAAQAAPIEINVNMLTSSYWPTSIVSTSHHPCVFPKEVTKAKEAFEEYYLSRHNGRVLTWNANMGTADVKARFKKNHEINMPTYAMVILMLFNNVESLSFEDIKQATNIPHNELIRHLLSISVAPKTRLLKKEPMSKTINSNDIFTINEKFESPMTRIKVLTISTNNTEERRVTLDQLDKSRKYETEAAIVRIMKTRKKLDHANLMSEVTRQLNSRFKPEPSHIKSRIEALLEREYLKRDEDERNVYHYLA